jgi:tripartite-type tricarboxylate transporter receptor subunit TctC
MTLKRHLQIALVTAVVLMAGSAIYAQTFPAKPIRVVTAEAGGGGDITTRIIALDILNRLGHPLVIDNRGGVATIPAMIVASAPADGYTLLLYNNGFWTGPLMEQRPYDVFRDFTPVIEAGISPNILVINAQLPVRNVREFISLAKSKPGALNYASGAIGGSGHLAGELFKSMAGLNIVRVSYKGVNLGLNAVGSGEVQLMFPTVPAATPHMKAGRVRALGVTSLRPSVLAPGVPTIAAEGVPGYEAVSVMAVFAPKATPAAIIARLNADLNDTINKPDIREKLLEGGLEAVGGTPQQLAATVNSEVTRLGKVIKDADIHAE